MAVPQSASEVLAAPDASAPPAQSGAGVLAAFAAYFMWGFLPLLFRQLDEAGSVLIVAERTAWSLVLLAGVVAWTRQWPAVRAVLRRPKQMAVLALAAALLAGNWLLYVWAVETGQVLEASFGYFINPLVNVAMGMVLLGERQNRWQAVSILIAVLAIGIQAIGLGGIPFIALGLALSFGFYGYFRKTARLGPATGLFAETLLLAPFALGYVAWNVATEGWGVHGDPVTFLLLMSTGPATAIPLLLFGFAIQRLRLTTIGMFQYLAPTLQFFVALWVFHEPINGTRLLSFALIWVSVLLFTLDSVHRHRRQGRVRAA